MPPIKAMVIIQELVEAALSAVPVQAMMDAVRSIASLDRYQASTGIERAAALVSELATGAGLDQVNIHEFKADGTARWWNWEAPTAWTPRTATLTVELGGEKLELDHLASPFTIATHSAPT